MEQHAAFWLIFGAVILAVFCIEFKDPKAPQDDWKERRLKRVKVKDKE
ncbi:MAG TPA: hypothetical protein VKT73_15065 [Xanthobacteraceae bacterium]|nr:hypothetical protein [Xanthobacteraceae bacterium]